MMADQARDRSLDVDERLELAVFGIGERASQAKTQRILNDVEKAQNPCKLASMPEYSVKDLLAQTCRDLGLAVRDVPKTS